MKTLIALLISASSGLALAHTDSFTTRAKVIWAEPEYETIEVNEPETKCWDETVDEHPLRDEQIMPMIVGGVIGGVVGHQFGDGRGNDASTVAGSIIGSMVGHEWSGGEDDYRVVSERRCTEVDHWHSRRQLVGYRVKYRYAGNDYFTHTQTHPGDWMDVRVRVDPLE